MQRGSRRVSVNEMLRVARRVLTALGAGPGCEVEPARAVVWLEMRRLGGLACLHADLEALAAQNLPRRTQRVDGVETLDGEGASSLIPLQEGVGLLACEPAAHRIRVVDVQSATWLAPCLACAAGPAGLWGVAQDGGEPLLQVVTHTGEAVLRGAVPVAELAGRRCEITLGNGVPPRAPAGAWVLEAATLARRSEDALGEGVAVDEEIWSALAAVARRTLVPASERSRLHGAGGGDDNA